MRVADLDRNPHPILARLRTAEPVSWVPDFGRWLVTDRTVAIDVLRDADAFTVDDPRFSTGQVVGPSMLSLDGSEHRRHRAPFQNLQRQRWCGVVPPPATPLPLSTSGAGDGHDDGGILVEEASQAVEAIAARRRSELRTELAGPFAASVIGRVLGLVRADAASAGTSRWPAEVLGWYRAIVGAVTDVDAGRPIDADAIAAMDGLRDAVDAAVAAGSDPLTGPAAVLSPSELVANVAVTLFGAIETVEAMVTNALYHLLTDPPQYATVAADPALLPGAIEESLRLEPGAAIVDRYTTRAVDVGGVTIPARELVSVSLAAANRDPTVFPDPDRFDPRRANASSHLAFATGPHACIGAALARAEAAALIAVLLKRCPRLALEPATTDPPTGLIFRKPARLTATW